MAGGRLTKEALLKIAADDGDTELKLDRITAKADELRKMHPTLKLRIDSAEASAKLKIFRAQLDAATRNATVTVSERAGKYGLLGKLLFGSQSSSSGGGLTGMFASLSKAFASLGIQGGGSGASAGGSTAGSFAGTPAGAAAIAGLAVLLGGPLLVELTGLVSGLAAATAGIGAFGLLALPTFTKVTNALAQTKAAQTAYNNAEALYKVSPTAAHATAAANALLKLKAVQQSMSPSTREAVKGINGLTTAFDQMAKKFQPTVLQVLNAGLKVANTLLPDLAPFAQAAGGAINGLLGKLDVFFRSADFRKWLGSFVKLVGPSITAIGRGLGQVGIAFGKLVTRMSAKDVSRSISIAFTAIASAIKTVTWTVGALMRAFDFWHNTVPKWTLQAEMKVASIMIRIGHIFTVDVPHWLAVSVGWWHRLPGMILNAIGNLGGLLVRAGRSLISGLISGIKSAIPGLSGVLSWVTSLIPSWKGPLDKDRRLLYPHGQAIMAGLNSGIASQLPALSSTLSRATSRIAGHSYGGGGRSRSGVLQVEWIGGQADAQFMSWLRKNIRIRGGDPTVLGR